MAIAVYTFLDRRFTTARAPRNYDGCHEYKMFKHSAVSTTVICLKSGRYTNACHGFGAHTFDDIPHTPSLVLARHSKVALRRYWPAHLLPPFPPFLFSLCPRSQEEQSNLSGLPAKAGTYANSKVGRQKLVLRGYNCQVRRNSQGNGIHRRMTSKRRGTSK